MKLFLVCKVEILQVTINKIEVLIIFLDGLLTIFGKKCKKIAKKSYLGFLLMFI